MKKFFKKEKAYRVRVTMLNLSNNETETGEFTIRKTSDLSPIVLNGFDILKIEKI